MKKSNLSIIKLSAKEFTIPSSIAICGMLLAMRVVLGIYANFSLNLFREFKFSLNYIPIAIAAMLFGPFGGLVVGGFGDILSFILNPVGGAYFPGWTINGIISGTIYGLFLYKKELKISRLIFCCAIISIVELFLGTLWLYLGSGLPMAPTFISRLVKFALFFPFETGITFFLLNLADKVNKHATKVNI